MRKRSVKNIILALLAVAVVSFAGFLLREKIIMMRGSRLAKVTVDEMNRNTLTKAALLVNDDPNMLATIIGYITDEAWSVNEALARVVAEESLFSNWAVEESVKEGFLVRNARSRNEFRDPWGKHYDFQLVDGRITLMPRGPQASQPVATTMPAR